MPWHVAVVGAYEHQARFYLLRRGIRSCAPVDHDYTPRKHMKPGGFKIVHRFPGYAFVEFTEPHHRAIAKDCPHIFGLLGSMTEEGFKLGEIPKSYITDLMDAPPRHLNRNGSSGYNKGQKVEFTVNAITKIIGVFSHMLDKKGRAVITVGGKYDVPVSIERLQAAE
jgi:transcription antitermination factor NusG